MTAAEIKARYPRRPRVKRCPVCEAWVTWYVLDWHINKYHDDGQPMALDED